MALGHAIAPGFERSALPWLRDLVEGLRRDGLLQIDAREGVVRLP
jgi:hypothetical protein